MDNYFCGASVLVYPSPLLISAVISLLKLLVCFRMIIVSYAQNSS